MKEIIEYINNVFGIANETSATIIITLSVFIFGFIVTGFANLIRKYLIRRSYRKLFFTLATGISNDTLRQAINLHKLKSKFRIDYLGDFAYNKHTINHLDNITKISFDIFYKAFFTGAENLRNKKKRKAFDKIWANITLIIELEKNTLIDLSDFIAKLNGYENKRRDAVKELKKYIDIYIRDIVNTKRATDPTIKQYHEEFVKITEKAFKIENSGHFYFHQKHFIEPFFELNKKHIIQDFIMYFNNEIIEVTNAYNNIEKLIYIYSQIFHSHYFVYRKAGYVIKKGVEILDKHYC